MLTEFIESFVAEDPEILNRQSDIYLDIDAIKEAKDMESIDPESLVALSLVLLKQLQPYITELNDTKLQLSYQKKMAENNSVLEEEEDPAGLTAAEKLGQQATVTLTSKEDE